MTARAGIESAALVDEKPDDIPCSAEVVQLRSVDAISGAAGDEVWYGVAVSGRYGAAITRSARSLAELAQLVGDLSHACQLWSFVQDQDRIGTFDGQLIDPVANALRDLARQAGID